MHEACYLNIMSGELSATAVGRKLHAGAKLCKFCLMDLHYPCGGFVYLLIDMLYQAGLGVATKHKS